jgi:serine/threonine protein phosphatase PrpC
MVVTCPSCGLTTHDLEFCDHCNADLIPVASPATPADPPLERAELRLSKTLLATLTRAEAAVLVEGDGRLWRVHWITAAEWEECSARVRDRMQCIAAPLPGVQTTEAEGGVWVCVETQSCCATPWLASHKQHPFDQLRHLLAFLEPLTAAIEGLHERGLIWLNFDPRHVELVEETVPATARITNLDLMLYSVGPSPDLLPILPAFAPPEVTRFVDSVVGKEVDVYHLSLFAYYWLADLLPNGFAGSGLEAFRHEIPPLRIFTPDLPPGIAPVIERGLAIDPAQRWPTPRAFLEALTEAVQRARARWESAATIVWDVGSHSRTGRAKEALNRANEDDVLVHQFTDPDRALVAVADGLTCCTVGSGGLASLLAFLALENTVGEDCRAANFPERLAAACRRGGEVILAWAIERGHRWALLNGRELMASTLLTGWLEGNRLSLGNLGDSRAYLIEEDRVEQLTVDGDVRSFWLARGIPPEDVAQIGALGKSLRTCVGGFVLDAHGAPAVDPQHLEPAMYFCPLLPGDVVVLCTDGLVEEGVFLEATDLPLLIRENRTKSAAELAEALADAADAMQELPTNEWPDGCGDNISCVVIKVLAPEYRPDEA